MIAKMPVSQKLLDSRIRENIKSIDQLPVTDKPVEFEKQSVKVQGFRNITGHFRGNLENIPQIESELLKVVTM